MKRKLLEEIGVLIEGWNEFKTDDVFGETCRSRVTYVLTVIFEVETGVPEKNVKRLYNLAKRLSSDNVRSRCIIVLK